MACQRRIARLVGQLQSQPTSSKGLKYVFITGCSRGIGYGLVEHFLHKNDSYYVIASCRSPDKANKLKSLLSKYSPRSTLITLDTSNENSIINAMNKIIEKRLRVDILINNAGIVATKIPSYQETVIHFDKEELCNVLNINLIGPASIFKYIFTNNLFGSNARIVNITSNVASLTRDTDGNFFSYRISKTALNMLTVLQQMQIGNNSKFNICCIDPGHVQTKMGMEQSGFETAPLTVDQTCNGILTIIESMKTTDKYNGRFLKYNGSFLQF